MRCGDCKFFMESHLQRVMRNEMIEINPGMGYDEEDEIEGTCHRFPPSVDVFQLESLCEEWAHERVSSFAGSWKQPAVCTHDWCGEWQPKPDG